MSLQTHNEIELEKALQELTSTQMGRRLFLQAAPLLIASACARQRTSDSRNMNVCTCSRVMQQAITWGGVTPKVPR